MGVEPTIAKQGLASVDGTRRARRVYAPQFITRSAAIVGWGRAGDVSGQPRGVIADRVNDAFPSEGARQRGRAANTLFHLVHSMQIDDLVVTPEPASRTLLLGRVSGPYGYLDEPIARTYSHAREVRWFAACRGMNCLAVLGTAWAACSP